MSITDTEARPSNIAEHIMQNVKPDDTDYLEVGTTQTAWRVLLRHQMNLWRAGERSLPQEFIDLHRKAAEADIRNLMTSVGMPDYPATGMIDDGNMDGMRVLRVIGECGVEHQLRQFRWSTSNGGCWMEKLASGGQALHYIPQVRPGHL